MCLPYEPESGERHVYRRVVPELEVDGLCVRGSAGEPLDELVHVERAQCGAHVAGEVVAERAVHEQIEFVSVQEKLSTSRK